MIDTAIFLLKANDSLNQIVNNLSSSQKIVEQQSAIINGLNSNIEILGIWVAIVSIVLPIAMGIINYFNYQGFSNKIYDSIRNQNKESILLALNKLESDDKTEVYNASLFMSNQFEYKFTDKELSKVVSLYEKSVDNFLKMALKGILVNNPSLVSDRFFRKIIKTEDLNQNLFNVFRYQYNSSSDFNSELLERLIKSRSKLSDYVNFISTSIHISPKITFEFLDNPQFVDLIIAQPINEVLNNLIHFTNLFSQGNFKDTIKFEDTLFYKKVFEIKLTEEKKNLEINVAEAQTSIPSIIDTKGLKFQRSKIYDKDGNEYESEKIAYTAFGPAKIVDAVIVDGRYITLNEIKNHIKSKK